MLDHPVLTHAPLPMGTLITIPTQKTFHPTQTPGPLTTKNPIIRTWQESKHGWPADTQFTITGVEVLKDTTTRIDEVTRTQTRTIDREQIVYLARLQPLSRQIRIHPQRVQTI